MLCESHRFSVHTLHGYIRAARRLFHWLEDEGALAANPARRLELPRLPKGTVRGIEHEDLKKMLAAAACPRDLALTWFFYSTAARCGGVVNLRLGDLKLERGMAYVTEKGSKTRVVFLVPQAVEALRAWLAVRPTLGPDDHVFTGLRGALRSSGVYQVLERLAKAAGVVSGWNPHSFRHRRLRDLQAAGVSLGVVSQIAGHADVSVTVDIYGRLPENELQRASQIPLPFSLKDT
jgi:site-specific recombinase XerD